MRVALKRVVPWIVAAVVLGWLFTTVPRDALLAALRRVPPHLYLLLVVAHIGATLAADAFACLIIIRSSLPSIVFGYFDALTIRAATYLLGLVNYGVGQGGIALFLNQRHRVGLPEAFGVVLLMAAINLSVVAAAAAAGLLVGAVPPHLGLRTVVISLACLFPSYLLVVAWRPRFLARVRLLAPVFAAGLRGNLLGTAARAPHFLLLLAGHYLAMHLFGVKPTVGQVLTLLPLVFFVAIVPVSPFGLGTAQAIAVALFAPLAVWPSADERQAAVLAYSLSFQVLGMIVQALIGLAFLRRVTRPATVEPGGADE